MNDDEMLERITKNLVTIREELQGLKYESILEPKEMQ